MPKCSKLSKIVKISPKKSQTIFNTFSVGGPSWVPKFSKLSKIVKNFPKKITDDFQHFLSETAKLVANPGELTGRAAVYGMAQKIPQ